MANISDWLIPILTVFGTIFAGAGLKFIESWLRKAKDKDDTATNLRNELRGELTALKVEIQATERELDEWRKKYYDIIEQYIVIKAQLEQAKRMLNEAGLTLPEFPPLTKPPTPGTI